jgi:hypothetical protein
MGRIRHRGHNVRREGDEWRDLVMVVNYESL